MKLAAGRAARLHSPPRRGPLRASSTSLTCERQCQAVPSLREIRKLPIVDYYESGELARTWIHHHYRADPGTLRIRAHVAAVDFVLELIVKDVGVGVVPRDVVAQRLASGALRQIKTRRRELFDTIWLNQIRGFTHEPIAARLIDEMSRAFAS